MVLLLHKGISSRSYYVASENCQECHQAHYQAWHETTLHPKQFRPVRGPEDLLGDFTSDNPALTFKQEEVEFVIGNKWEQVYVRMIDGEYYPLPAKWLIPLQKWIPYKVDSWRQTPMS
ncbi:MAG: cytochrome C, partial [Gammaproteobacteria bacterium]|nr:cytochrome C [Gammaproteobacteria bacterium]